MGKLVPQNSVYRGKNQAGCMSGLISIFNFRQVRTSQKLLPDRRRWSRRYSTGTGYPKNNLKLLSDSVGRREDKNDGDENKTSEIDICRRSVKKLMEEEMFNEQKDRKKIRTASMDSQEPEYSHLELVSLMEEFCSHVSQRLHHENRGDSSYGQELSSSVRHDQLDELYVKLSEAAEVFLNQKLIGSGQTTDGAKIYQTKQFMDALEILNSKKELLNLLNDSNSLLVKYDEDQQNSQSEEGEPEKSLGRIKSSEEDTDSSTSTQCQELVSEQISKQNMYKIFRRKVKSDNKNPSKDLDSPGASNRIVLLNSNPTAFQNSVAATSPLLSTQFHNTLRNQEQGGIFNSKFSLREIKKRLKLAMGESRKEQHRISMDAILHKIPSENQGSADCIKEISSETTRKELVTKTYSLSGRSDKPLNCDPVNDHEITSTRNDTSKSITIEDPRYSNIYLEAKKHLIGLLNTREEELNLSTIKVPKSLEKTLSLPEYVSPPIYSPMDTEHIFETAQMRFSFSDNFGVVSEKIWNPVKENDAVLRTSLRKNLETELQTDDDYIKLQVLDLNPDTSSEFHETVVQETTVSTEDSSAVGGEETLETIKSVCAEDSKSLDDLSESNSRDNCGTETFKTWEEEGSSQNLMDKNIKNEPSISSLGSSSSSCLLDQESEAQGSINDGGLAWDSPTSVLKPFYLEDATSPAASESDPAELKIEPLRICFDEHDSTISGPEIHLTSMKDKKNTFEYVRAVLQASGLSWEEFTTNYSSSNHLLKASLFDEVEVSYSRLCGEPKLIFDCIDEVLAEVYERYFGCPPWLKFIKSSIRPIPVGSSIIREVWESIDWHLIPEAQKCTLDHIIGKNYAKEGNWVNLQLDIEDIGIEISEAILIELKQEAVVNLCYGVMP